MTATKYSMSFTTGALLYHESMKLAALYLSLRKWDKVRNAVIADNIIQSRTTNTLKRITNEITSRVKTLGEREILFLNEAEYTEQRYVLWLAICRRYAFIADFTINVVHDNFASLKNSVAYEDYDIFFGKKAEWHGELDRIAPSTKNKLRQTLFKMMQEAHILDKNNSIIPAVPSAAFQALLASAEQHDAMFLPIAALSRRAG
jgi:hypothetical protein